MRTDPELLAELDETPNKAPLEGCGFCPVLDDERPDECEGCPHEEATS